MTFYQDNNYAGSAVTLVPGTYTTAQLAAAGIPSNSVSSIKVPAGLQVEVYDEDNFEGTRWLLLADTADLSSVGCDNAMDSVKIEIAANTSKIGDVNKDGYVDALDMVLIQKHLLGIIEL